MRSFLWLEDQLGRARRPQPPRIGGRRVHRVRRRPPPAPGRSATCCTPWASAAPTATAPRTSSCTARATSTSSSTSRTRASPTRSSSCTACRWRPWRCGSTMPPAPSRHATRLLAKPFAGPIGEGELAIPAVRGVGGSLLYFVGGAGEHAVRRGRLRAGPGRRPAPDLGLLADRPSRPGRAADRVPELDPVLPRHPRPPARGADRPQRPARPDRQPGPDQRRPHPAPAAQRLAGAGLRRRPLHGAHGRRRRAAHRVRLPGHLRRRRPRCRTSCSCRSRTTTTRTSPPASGSTTRSSSACAPKASSTTAPASGEFLHFFTRTINGLFFEVLERRGGYDRYGEANAPARLAAQALLDRSLGEAITELRG